MKEQELLDELKKDGLVCDDMVDARDFKGTDWKNMSIAKWFQFCKANKEWLEPGISWWELAALHMACEMGKKPATILETGQCYGTTARYFLIRNQKYGGTLTSVELVVRPKFDAMLEDLGLASFVTTIRAHSQKILWDKMLDILFIDSEHCFSDALGEYMKYRLFLTQGSIVGYHDTENCNGVAKAIQVMQEIDDLELLNSVPMTYGAGIKLFKVQNMNTAQIRINKEFEEKRMAEWKKAQMGAKPL